MSWQSTYFSWNFKFKGKESNWEANCHEADSTPSGVVYSVLLRCSKYVSEIRLTLFVTLYYDFTKKETEAIQEDNLPIYLSDSFFKVELTKTRRFSIITTLEIR